ncbi:MAG: beta-galactosidase, partial [Bacteroidaceae bacterium]|nr:beta-galactosidase [Bacteroidaceae bacterium]
MKTKASFLLYLLLCITFSSIQAQNVREKTRINNGWKFAFGHATNIQKDFNNGTEYFNYLTKANSIHNEGPYTEKFNDSTWQQIQIPHDWVTQLPYASTASHSHGYKTVGWKYPETSVGWYRKTFHIPANDLGKNIALQFDGIFRNATVWFNGFYMGTEQSGYATQIYDITEYVNYGGDNLICVRADASLEEGWFYEGAGIYRDVWLLKTSNVSVAPFGTFVHAKLNKSYTTALLHIDTEVKNNAIKPQVCDVEQRLLDADGNVIATCNATTITLRPKETVCCKQQLEVKNPHLWNTYDPYLYKVKTTIKVGQRITDEYETVTGIREAIFDADKGFLLNGKQVKIKGVNMHQDHAGVGSALPEALMLWRIRELKKIGCNAYRASHNPMTPAQLDICDREGILVIEENRLTGINEEHLRLLEKMIKRDRNHPSIILWSDG